MNKLSATEKQNVHYIWNIAQPMKKTTQKFEIKEVYAHFSFATIQPIAINNGTVHTRLFLGLCLS